MKDLFKKFTNLRNNEETKIAPSPEQSFRQTHQPSHSFSLSERTAESSAKFAEISLLVGFFKATNDMWAPFFMDEREYNNHKTFGDGNAHIRSRRGNNAAATMQHPFMYGVVIHLLDAFSNGTIQDLKKITQEYRSGAAKLDFSTGHPVIIGIQHNVQKEEATRPQLHTAPAASAPVPQEPAQPVVIEPVIQQEAKPAVVETAPIEIAAPVVETLAVVEVAPAPVAAAQPVAIAVAENVVAPVTVTTLADLLPGIGDCGVANSNSSQPEQKAKTFTPVSLPYGGLSEALARAEESLDHLPHISSSAGGLIQYASQPARLN